MRKRLVVPAPAATPGGDADAEWLNLEKLCEVELTSEDPVHPIDSALLPGRDAGWRAAAPGEQTIRLIFDAPQRIARIRLVFREEELERAQEFVLRVSAEAGRPPREIVRQQWNFSPAGATCEIEDYRLELPSVALLELTVDPDRGAGRARASLAELRVA